MNQRELHSTITDLTLLTNTLRMRRDALKIKVRGLEKRVKVLEQERDNQSAAIEKLALRMQRVAPPLLQHLEDGYLADVTA